MDLRTAARALGAYLDSDIPAMLWGAPGIGKSDVVGQVARDHGLPLIDLRVTLLDPVDLRGLPYVDSAGLASWARPVFLPDAARDGSEGVLFLDELNAAPASTQAACFQLVLNRRLGEYRLPAGWRIVAAGNRQSDRAAAQRMPSALANRFAHLEADPDLESWVQWANSAGIAPVVVAFLRFRPALLHRMPVADERSFPTPRAWESVAKVAMRAASDLRLDVVTGLVGEGPAAEFEGFMRVFTSLPSMREIISDPRGAAVPTDPATLYAVASAIARKADPSNFAAIMSYSQRLPKEFDILTAVDATKRDPSLCETTSYVEWINRNSEVFA